MTDGQFFLEELFQEHLHGIALSLLTLDEGAVGLDWAVFRFRLSDNCFFARTGNFMAGTSGAAAWTSLSLALESVQLSPNPKQKSLRRRRVLGLGLGPSSLWPTIVHSPVRQSKQVVWRHCNRSDMLPRKLALSSLWSSPRACAVCTRNRLEPAGTAWSQAINQS